MKRWRREEWDWPPTRRRRYRTVDVYQPSGWSSSGARKAVDIYFRVTFFIVKMLVSIPLAILAVGAFWLLGVIIWVLWTGWR
jgi:hypothetical protein